MMMKSLTIIAMAAASVNAGTNKTLAPTPGVDRPNAQPVPPPITPFPTEPNVVSYLLYVVLYYCLLQLVCGAGV